MLVTLAASWPSARKKSLRTLNLLPSGARPAKATVMEISSIHLISRRYSTSSFITTHETRSRMSSASGKPFSVKNAMRASTALFRYAVFAMCALKSMSAQLAVSL